MEINVHYAVNGNEFIITNYNNAKAFASFLPAIAGLWGKPLWVYYVNRGQAISSLGVQDKDGAMLEFVAANKAWRLTASQGFRTFYKVNGIYYEPFQNAPGRDRITQTMYIKPHSVRLVDRNEAAGIETEITACTLPGEFFPALLRRLAITNISSKTLNIECIDGLPILHPFGTRNWMLKNLSRLAEGWFAGVHFTPGGVPYYKLPVEALDRPEIVPLHGAHFYCGIMGGASPRYCIDPNTVFGEQRDYAFPAEFLEQDSPFAVNPKLTAKNKTPSAMGCFSLVLPPDAGAVYYSMVGHCSDYTAIDTAAAMISRNGFFEDKEKHNEELMRGIASCAYTESAYRQFDTYCAQNCIDNALRGGFPVSVGKTAYYAYSRVHGDMEREYNNFVVLSEYFSQGNGNYRDVNQNRRSDLFYNRDIGDDNIRFFMNLIQSDGFNPLKVLGVRFAFETKEDKRSFINDLVRNAQNMNDYPDFAKRLAAYIEAPLTIGGLFNFIEDNNIILLDRESVLSSLLAYAKKTGLAEHGEGYWSDHWHYNTDLIENYLAIFPDRLEQLLIGRKDYIFYDDGYFVEPRSVKYALFRGKPSQIRAVRRDPEKAALIAARNKEPNAVRTCSGTGGIYYTNLLGKLLSLIANKYASLDPDGLGMEMETDKPNWCDALNGLPGLFGSSSAETLELLRLVSLVNKSLSCLGGDTTVPLAMEVSAMLRELVVVTTAVMTAAVITEAATGDFRFWDQSHTVKEHYREQTRLGLSGTDDHITINAIREILSIFQKKLEDSRARLESIATNGIIPTYFAYIPETYSVNGNADTPAAQARENASTAGNDSADGTAALSAIAEEHCPPLIISSFRRKDLPPFLEGPVHYLRLCPDHSTAEHFHRNMLQSMLYDRKLHMLKNNAQAASAGQDIGRITVFTPGWLENESIWLHMEYKYLLELLRNDLAQEFFTLAKTALVPFLDPNVYGRSIFENASFIASSAHPEEAIHGQGFVARLSGATAEFISMWIALTSGLAPFSVQDGALCLTLRPMLTADFFTAANTFTFNFLGSCTVVYHNESRRDTFGPQGASVQSYRITYGDGRSEEIAGVSITGDSAHAIRAGKAASMDVMLA